ncbi:FtsX-like permease family protein [bacterium]|nr:FtsX-like permease family protein [bacterium]
MLDLALAARNLFRHKVRSAIAFSALIFGVVSLLLSGGFIDWIYWAMRESTITNLIGHIQAVRPGYYKKGAADPFAYLLPEDSKELKMIQSNRHVKTVTSRLIFGGLISLGDNTISFLGQGVIPEKETTVSAAFAILKGNNLTSDDPKGVILGQGLADNMQASPGDRVIFLTTNESGGVNAVEGHVRGIFSTMTKAFDDAAIRMPITLARELLGIHGSHTWVILLDQTENTDAALYELKATIPESKIEFIPWNDLADFYHKTVQLFSRQMHVVQLIIALIIILSISNTLTKNVLERTNEIGTLMAMGMRRKKVLKLFVSEGMLLGIVGGLIGLILGTVLAHIISKIGIPMPPPPGAARGFTGEIRLSWTLAATSYLLAIGTSTLASMFPAWKASRINIIDALRHNR